MSSTSTTWVAISRRAITHNVKLLTKRLPRTTGFLAVVKSNAYGHGLVETAKIAKRAGVPWLGTVNLAEALTLRQAGIKGRILVLSFFDPEQLDLAIRRNITLTVYNLSAAITINRIAKRMRKKVPIHLKLDTGTTRLGILPADLIHVAKKISQLSNVKLEGLFSHLADAESPNQHSANKQTREFTKALETLAGQGIRIPYPHLACSAATILNVKSHFRLARVGIALYGLWSIEKNGTHQRRLPLQPALSWHTRVLQVKTVPSGTNIGYGGTYTTTRAARIAILPVGYWDGYDRKLSNNGDVLIRGRRCPIRGRICMNLTMVDVSSVPGVRPGDIATLIGTDGGQRITADELAKRIKTINYEIVTRVNPTISRIYY